MNIELTIAILTAGVTAIGWLVSHILGERAERRRLHLEAQLEHTGKQLEELYGPLAFKMIEGQQVFSDLLDSLGRNYVFVEGEQLPAGELQTWLFWLENSFLPGNREIRELLRSKTHLIEGTSMPASYEAFLRHYSSWEIRHLRWTREQVEYSWHSSINWPDEFATDVLDTFRLLKQRHARLVGKL
jgi:hypothetical protein